MASRVTIQDIADALGLSRNTVSKAINNTGLIAESTREQILRKAAEMGYKQFSYFDISGQTAAASGIKDKTKREIALLTTPRMTNSHFASTMSDKIQQQLFEIGYSLTIYQLMTAQIETLKLPGSFDPSRTAGIICAELFNEPYCRMLTELDIPLLFADSPVVYGREPLRADILLMENESCFYSLIGEMKHRGKSEIGFIGEAMHCRSFYERYMGYRNAMLFHQLPVREEYCITGNRTDIAYPTDDDYRTYLKTQLQALDPLPDLFVCANDFVAIEVLHACRDLNISVPEQLLLSGFDDSSESRIITPPLTTVHIHTQLMGHAAVNLLLSRIKDPHLGYRILYTETELIYRKSTMD